MAQLHAFYHALLTRNDGSVFDPVSRSEFADLLGVLETVGLVTLSSSVGSPPRSPSKGARKGLARTKSFNMGSGSRTTQEVSFVEGARVEELARGLGIQSSPSSPSQDMPAPDVREEEVRSIWEREVTRIARESRASQVAVRPSDVFDDAIEN